jgi:hypothetical protein
VKFVPCSWWSPIAPLGLDARDGLKMKRWIGRRHFSGQQLPNGAGVRP